ncbi:MAG: hypothetical protein ACFFAO_09170 [Candidatus Hermodarchaeota archaeon]
MKLKIFVISYILLVLITIGFTPNACAITYEVGFKEGDEFIWTCNVCDKNKIKEVLGSDWDGDDSGIFENLRQNSRLRWVIYDIDNKDEIYLEETEDNETVFSIKYYKWSWTTNEKWGNKDRIEESYQLKDPKDYPDDYNFPQFVPVWIPLPLGDYLKNLDLDYDYTIDARVLPSISCEIDKNEIKNNYPKQNIKIVALYTDQGVLKSYKLYIKDHQVIIDISLDTFITYNFLIISIITAIIYVGIVIFIYKLLKK